MEHVESTAHYREGMVPEKVPCAEVGRRSATFNEQKDFRYSELANLLLL